MSWTAFTLLLLLTACGDQPATLVKGAPTPAFVLENLQGNSIRFPRDFRNRVVIISFWADWCPACKKEMRDLEHLYRKYGDRGLAILFINIEQEKARALAFIGDLSLSYEVLLDSTGEVTKAYGVSSIPSLFILDRQGVLHTRVLGETPAEMLESALRPLF